MMDAHSKSQVKRLVAQSPEYAAGYQAGREAGMREAAMIAKRYEPDERHPSVSYPSDAILSAIGGGK